MKQWLIHVLSLPIKGIGTIRSWQCGRGTNLYKLKMQHMEKGNLFTEVQVQWFFFRHNILKYVHEAFLYQFSDAGKVLCIIVLYGEA